VNAGNGTGSLRRSRAALRARLEARHSEIEQALLTRVYAISDPTEASDPGYVEGLRRALDVAFDYALAAIELGEERVPEVPAELLTQARMAARNGVGLDTVLRRYVSGYSLLGEFVLEEVEGWSLLRDAALRRVLRGQAAVLERLIAVVSEEYGRASSGRINSGEQRRARRVERLLAGEPIDATELGFDPGAHHLGAVVQGPEVARPLRDLAASLDARLFLIRREEGVVWAWLGSRRRIDYDDVAPLARATLPRTARLAIGEPGEAIAGWRRTHKQAEAAFAIARRGSEPVVRYADVALLAAALRDDLLFTSLHDVFLAPLADERDGGMTLRQTLQAYLAAGCNATSASAALGVSRQTVNSRLRAAERRIGRSLEVCAAELRTALRLRDLAGVDPLCRP
jgi:PucR C-terminal helix-turn-helix domain/GGDEF-like domain